MRGASWLAQHYTGYWEAFREEGCCLLNELQARAAVYLSSMEQRGLGWRSMTGIELVGVSSSSCKCLA